jgi:NAD(P)-dependent dehydrogenase (short-subunit alcohol dehydrogenase family)
LESGANVCIGDLDNISGERLLKNCRDNFHPEEEDMPPRAVFQTTDVTNYPSVLALFDLAFKTYKRIDHVVSAAGIVEIGNWFDFGLTLEDVRQVCGIRQRPWLLGPSMASQSNALSQDSNP